MNYSGCEEGTEQVHLSSKVGPQSMESSIKIDSSEPAMSAEEGRNNSAPTSSRDFIPENSSLPPESLSLLKQDTQLILELSQEVLSLKYQLDDERAFRAREENQLSLLIQAVTEAEAELDRFGRGYENYQTVLSQLIKATCCPETMTTKTSYSSWLTKLVFTVYSNHMKAMESRGRLERPYFTSRPTSNLDEDFDGPLTDDRLSVRSSLERLDFDDDYVSDDAERCLSALARTEDELDGEDVKDIPRFPSPLRPFSAPCLEIVREEEDGEIEMQCQEEIVYTLGKQGEKCDQVSQVNEVLENVLERVDDIIGFRLNSPTQDCDPFESNFHKYMKVEPLREVPNVEVVEGILVEIVKSPTSVGSVSIDSAIGSGNFGQRHSREDTASNSSDNCANQRENTALVDDNQGSSQDRLQLLWVKVEELNEAFKSQSRELSAAIDKVSQLEENLSKIVCRGSMNSECNAIEDEIKAWKELVEQQKGVVEKITSELDSAKHELKQRNFLIEQLMVEKEAANNENSAVKCIVAKREAKLKNHITKVSSRTQVNRDDESEITCHNHTASPMIGKDGFQSQIDDDKSVLVYVPKLEGTQNKREETTEWIQLYNDDLSKEDEDINEEHPPLEQMDLLSFSYLNSPCRRKIENSSQRKIQFLDTDSHKSDHPCDQVPAIHRSNSSPAKRSDTSPSNHKFFHCEHVLNAPESPEHLTSSKFLSRPDHIPTHPLPFTASSSSTVTENPALTVLGYESSLDGHRKSLDVEYVVDSGTRCYSNNEVYEERDEKWNKESQKLASFHDYCTQPKFCGSSNPYNDSFKRFAKRIELAMSHIEIILVPNSVTQDVKKRNRKMGNTESHRNRSGAFLPFLVLDSGSRKLPSPFIFSRMLDHKLCGTK